MKRTRWGPMAMLSLAVAVAVPVSAAAKVAPGMEFIYTGTLEWKQTGTDVPKLLYRAAVRLSTLVTEASPERGYTVIGFRVLRPEKGPDLAELAPAAEVFTRRYRPDLSGAPGPNRGPRPIFGSPLTQLTWNRPIPFGVYPDLRVGNSWMTEEIPGLAGVTSPTVTYTVVGETKIGGRNCRKIDATVKDLPVKTDWGDSLVSLTEYTGSRCMDPELRLLTSDHWRATVLYRAGRQEARVDVSTALDLTGERQLSGEEVATRTRQAEAIDRIEQTTFASGRIDRRKQLEEAKQAIDRFRREYPASPYVPAVTTIESSFEREAHLLALQDKRAPAFRLPSLEGKEQTLGAYRGKLVLLNFFASW
jgi:hypothetical protein